jgi:hypothetical protein
VTDADRGPAEGKTYWNEISVISCEEVGETGGRHGMCVKLCVAVCKGCSGILPRDEVQPQIVVCELPCRTLTMDLQKTQPACS